MGARAASYVALAVLGLGTVAGCGDDDDGDTAEAATPEDAASTYADDVCSAGVEWIDALGSISEDLAPDVVASNADPFVYVQQMVGDAITATRQFADGVEAADPPDTEVGRQVSQVFDDTVSTVTASFEDAAAVLLDAPNAASVEDAVARVAADVSTAAQDAGASLRDVQASDPDDELSDALELTPSCQELRSSTPT